MSPEHRAAKRRIKDAIRVWRHLVPPNVTIKHIFIEGSTATCDKDVLAETDVAWEYHQAKIRWSLHNATGVSQKYIDGTLVHELVHVMLGAIESQLRTDEGEHSHYVNAVCEHTVETLAAAIIRVAR